MRCLYGKKYALFSLFFALRCSLLLPALSSTVSAKPATVEVPLSKLINWENSLKYSAQQSSLLETTIAELKTRYENSKKIVLQLEESLATLQRLSENYRSTIETLSEDLETWKQQYQSLLEMSQALQATYDELLTQLQTLKRRRLRDTIIAGIVGAGAGAGILSVIR